jgi:hypothetical protein
MVFVCVLVLPAYAADEIVRGNKSSGGTAFQSGEIIKASEVNTDFDTVYTKINGNIDTGNLADGAVTSAKLASGALDLANVADEQNTTAELFEHADGVADAGLSKYPDRNAGTPNGLATTAAQEIYQIRKTLRRIALGDSVVTGDGDAGASGTQAKAGAWFDPPFRGPNLLFNGDFELKETAATACPDGWTDILGGGAPTYSQQNQAVADGDGKYLRIAADTAAEQGCSQTLTSLKASRNYLVVARVKDFAGTCKIETTGDDDTTDFPAIDRSVVLKLVTNDGATDSCEYDHVGVYELNADPIPAARRVVAYESSTEAACDVSSAAYTIVSADNGDACDTELSVSVTIPSPGCVVEVDGMFSGLKSSGSGLCEAILQIHEDAGAVGVAHAISTMDEAGGGTVSWVNTAPTVGATHAYTIGVRSDCATGGQELHQGGSFEGNDLGSSLKVVMECGG